MIFQKIKISIFIVLSIICLTNTYAQLDNPNSNDNLIPSRSIAPNIEVEKSEFIDPRYTDESEIQNAIADVLEELRKEEERNELKNKGIATQAQLREERAKKSKSLEIKKPYAKIDQFLGGFSTVSDNITIVCRDFQYPDGDVVTILVNDKPVIRNVVLTRGYQQFTLPLVDGLNVISFMAMNQGTSGPNTAAFMVFDDEANVISKNEWNLATGAKAVLSIAKIKGEN